MNELLKRIGSTAGAAFAAACCAGASWALAALRSAGTAAATAADRCANADWRIAVIDHPPYGGTCALRGCDPKKVLVGVAEALDLGRRMRGKGLAGGGPSIDWRGLMAFKRGFTERVPGMMKQSFQKRGMGTYPRARALCRPALR